MPAPTLIAGVQRDTQARQDVAAALLGVLHAHDLIPEGDAVARQHDGSELFTHLFGRDFPPSTVPPERRLFNLRNIFSGHHRAPAVPHEPAPPGAPELRPDPTLSLPAPLPAPVQPPPPDSASVAALAGPDEPSPAMQLEEADLIEEPPPEATSSAKEVHTMPDDAQMVPVQPAPFVEHQPADLTMKRFMLHIRALVSNLLAEQNVLPEEVAARLGVPVDDVESLIGSNGHQLSIGFVFRVLAHLGQSRLSQGSALRFGFSAPAAAPPGR